MKNLCIALVLLFVPMAANAAVHATLYSMERCPDCKRLADKLPAIEKKYGSELTITKVDVSTPAGLNKFYAAADKLGLPQGRRGVPSMEVDNQMLVGSSEITSKLPGIIEKSRN